jgi:ribonuclease HII
MRAMEGAVEDLEKKAGKKVDYTLVDGNRLPKKFDPEKSRAIVKGDSNTYLIAAASVIAKVFTELLILLLFFFPRVCIQLYFTCDSGLLC